jgi:thiamine transport system substrate-binding protein
MPRRRSLGCLLALALPLGFVACGDTSEPEGSAGPETGGTVRLLTHDSFALSDEVLASFTDDTGI